MLPALLCAISGAAQAAALLGSSAVIYEFPGTERTLLQGSPIELNGANQSIVGYANSPFAASGYGSASFGALHASAFSASQSGDRAELRGQGSATWIDDITISNTGSSGQAFAHAAFSLNGALSSMSDTATLGALANATVAASVHIDGQLVFSTGGQLVSRNGVIEVNEITRGVALNGAFESNPASNLSGTFFFDIPFQFGVPFRMIASLTAFTQAATSNGTQSSAHSDFDSSGYWGGISDVHLADGTLLSGYAISAQSGFDWGNAYAPVPEPAAAWLFGCALLCLLGKYRITARKRAGSFAAA
jgi:hypothetical protein